MKPPQETAGPHQIPQHGYIKNLNNCLKKIERDLEKSQEIEDICAGQRCRTIGLSLDRMAKDLYSISVPRWVADDYARTVRAMRLKLHELYTRYHGVCSHCNN